MLMFPPTEEPQVHGVPHRDGPAACCLQPAACRLLSAACRQQAAACRQWQPADSRGTGCRQRLCLSSSLQDSPTVDAPLSVLMAASHVCCADFYLLFCHFWCGTYRQRLLLFSLLYLSQQQKQTHQNQSTTSPCTPFQPHSQAQPLRQESPVCWACDSRYSLMTEAMLPFVVF